MSELLPGDPQAGFVFPQKDTLDGTGVLPPNEQTAHDDYQSAWQEDTDAVTTHEANVVQTRADDAAAAADAVAVSSCDPLHAPAAGPVDISVYGQNFTDPMQVRFDADQVPTVFIDATKVVATVDPAPYGEGNYVLGVEGCPDTVGFTFTPT